MSWSVEIKHDEMPEVREAVSSFCQCPGNMYMCVIELYSKQLRDMERDEAVAALTGVVKELDKGNSGIFNDRYCEESDEKWSKGKETRKGWDEWVELISKIPVISKSMPFQDYTTYCGYTIRERCREAAMRFFFYYKAGYNVIFEW